MGVTGLWRLIEPAGKPVPIETLENKVLAVDISIWLHQMVKGFQDAKGAPMPNAHLMGLFQRLCKILYYRIKPVFVFDGVYPELKKETIARRHESKARMNTESERIKREIMVILGKKTALGSLLGKQPSPKKLRPITDGQEDIFDLPALPDKDLEETLSNSNSSDSETDDEAGPAIDLHTVDLESEEIKNLPVREKYNLLTDLKETRKMNSWGKLNQLPKKSESFADYQMGRLLKRRKLQECIKETESLMDGNCMSLNELEMMLNDQGVDTKYDDLPTKRIASDDTTRYLLIKDVKQAIEDAKRREEVNKNACTSEIRVKIKEQADANNFDNNNPNIAQADTSWTHISTSSQDNSTFLVDSDQFSDEEFSNDDSCRAEVEKLSTVRDFMIQNTDFTHKSIKDIISKNTTKKQKSESKLNEILAELEKSFANEEKKEPAQNISDCNLSSTDTDDETVSRNITESPVKRETNVCKTKKYTPNNKNVLTSTTSVAASSEDCEIINDDMDEELRKAIQMSLECEKQPAKQPKLIENAELNVGSTNITTDTESDSDSFIEVLDKKQPKLIENAELNAGSQNITTDTESDSDSFIEVLDEKQPIVQLTVNMVDKIDDDIFADVFEHKLEETNIILASKNNPKPLFNIENTQSSNSTFIQNDELPLLNKVNETDIASSGTGIAIDKQYNSKTIAKPFGEQKRNPGEPLEKDITNKNTNCEVKFKLGEMNIENTSNTQYVMTNKTKEKSEVSENLADIQKEPIYTNEEICELSNILEQQQNDLLKEKRKLDRMGANISEQMTSEVQELLRIFGIPYVVAPMEAEAQCAFLEMAKLTDGTITDDSDIWLFGGRTVYKNFFNQNKHVVQFLAEKIERSFRLNREQLILLALLVGSDYTTGVSGVGPVTAMEILASFPGQKQKGDQDQVDLNRKCQSLVKGLEEFKKWVQSGRRTDDSSLRRKLKNVKIGNDFPSLRVVQAYLEPNVEKSKENFTWGVPDITVLRDYTRTKFGWNQNKLDDIINPVMKRFKNKQSQKSLQDYFERKVQFHPMEEQVSKRVKAAIDMMNPEGESSQKMETQAKPLKNRKSKAKRPIEPMPSTLELSQQILENPIEPMETHSKKKKRAAKTVLSNAVSTTGSDIPPPSGLPLKASLDLRDEETSTFKFKIPKSDQNTEIIPQKEKSRQAILENKLKAIELYRTSLIDKKRTKKKRVWPKAKEKADLSESDSE